MIKVFHAGYEEIKAPDVHWGRKNADFGQGFYTTDSLDFACGWVREKKGADIIINSYELDESGLKIKRFERDPEWFRYVYSNRRSMPDELSEYDVIIGPVANDTIFNTMGIMTSGFLSDDEAMRLLCIGPCFYQITLKTVVAADRLTFISSEVLPKEAIEEGKRDFSINEERYMNEFARVMEEMDAQ